MNNMRGITIKQLNTVLDDMKKIYEFDPAKTYFGDNTDPRCNDYRRVEIITEDDSTGVQITLAKKVTWQDAEED